MLKFRRYKRFIEGSGPSRVDSGASEQAFRRGLPISPGTVRPALAPGTSAELCHHRRGLWVHLPAVPTTPMCQGLFRWELQ